MATKTDQGNFSQKQPANLGRVVPASITTEMKKSYLDYAMSVIVARALPDVRDGLKPVQRRILYAMFRLNLTHRSAHKKCARIVGETIGKYHPHGDLAVYEALVRMAQDFSLRYPLVDGQGNFGSLDGDPPAAMRYTEARLTPIAAELLVDLDKNTVSFRPNFDASETEPEVLPARLPNFLLNGADGIAVGMATKIPPHNLGEVVATLQFLIQNLELKTIAATEDPATKESEALINQIWQQENASQLPAQLKIDLKESIAYFQLQTTVSTEKLMEFIKGPDFPTGGTIFDWREIVQAYSTGKGRILLRGQAEITASRRKGRYQIVISEIPYQLNKAQLVAKIAELIKEKKLAEIADLRDQSDRHGIKIVLELKASANPQQTLNRLYKFTPLETVYHLNMVALIRGTPQLLNLKTALLEYLAHRKEIIIRRSAFELFQALYRTHILEGLKIALDFLDEVIETIKKSADTETAKTNLITKFQLTPLQAQAILDLQLKRLAALERQKILDELRQQQERVRELKKLLQSPREIMNLISKELEELKEKYADVRRTKVEKGKPGQIKEEDLIKNEETVVILSRAGYIKRVSTQSFKTQKRGGKGVKAVTLKEEDVNQEILLAQTLDDLLFFTNQGRLYRSKVYQLPATSRTARGQALVNIIPLRGGEKIARLLNRRADNKKPAPYFIFATARGLVKKTATSEYHNLRRSGLTAIKIDPGDQLLAVEEAEEESDVILITEKGKSIRFPARDVRATGRVTRGVRGIKLQPSDQVIDLQVINPHQSAEKEWQILVVSRRGYGKQTPLRDYSRQHRGGQGVYTARCNEKTGLLAGSFLIHQKQISTDDLLIISATGKIIRLPLQEVPLMGRHTQGVRLFRLEKDDRVASLTLLRS